jgi:hypothetical protein
MTHTPGMSTGPVNDRRDEPLRSRRFRVNARWVPVSDQFDRVLLVILAVGAVLALWTSSYAGAPVLWFLATYAMFLVTALLWVISVVRSVIRRRVFFAALLAPLAVVLVGFAASLHLAEQARFAVSQNALDALVQRAGEPTVKLPSQQPAQEDLDDLWAPFPISCPSLVGMYSISHCETSPAGYIFHDTTGDMMSGAGLAYLPTGRPPYDIGKDSFEAPQFHHLHGNWYTFTSSW